MPFLHGSEPPRARPYSAPLLLDQWVAGLVPAGSNYTQLKRPARCRNFFSFRLDRLRTIGCHSERTSLFSFSQYLHGPLPQEEP